MKAVFRHELSSYFTGMTGYVFGAFLLLFAGIYTMAVNLNAGLSNFEYVLSNLSFIFLIIVPILTMRVIAEERRQRTDQLLYSLPLSMTGVALGKYAALLVVFLVPTGIICLYPLVLSAFGSVYLPLAFGTAVGFFFLGAALLAIGMFLSSITESQGVAAGLCFVVMLVNYFISDLASYFSASAMASFWAGFDSSGGRNFPSNDPEQRGLPGPGGYFRGPFDLGLCPGRRGLCRTVSQYGGRAVPV